MVEPPGIAPGSGPLITSTFIAISGASPGIPNIGALARASKGGTRQIGCGRADPHLRCGRPWPRPIVIRSMRTPSPSARLVLTYGLATLLTVATGCLVCALSGVPTVTWLRNLIAWGVGAGAAGGLAVVAGRRTGLVLLGVAVAGLAASLAGTPQDGAPRHRTR